MKTKTEFKWADKFPSKGLKAKEVGPYLARLEKKHGKLTPELLLKEAEKKRSPIHSFLNWNDKEAATTWRLSQCSQLLRSIKVSVKVKGTKGVRTVRAFVRISEVPDDSHERGAYISIKRAMSNEEYQEEVLDQARAELRSFRRKYKDLSELGDILSAIDTFLA